MTFLNGTYGSSRSIIVGLLDGTLLVAGISPKFRCLTSGWQIFNNKGKVVRQYEPYFADTYLYTPDFLVGVSPIVCYDPLGRTVATLHPDRSWEKVEFSPWWQKSWDRNDTAGVDSLQLTVDSVAGPFAKRIDGWKGPLAPGGGTNPLWGEVGNNFTLTEHHHDTYSLAFLDPLGKPFLTIAKNKTRNASTAVWTPEDVATREYTDIEGNRTKIIDALGRESLLYFYDILQRPLRTESIDGGRRWMLTAVDGQPVRRWDERNHVFIHEYDKLRRPTKMWQGTDLLMLNVYCNRDDFGPEPDSALDSARSNNRVGQLVRSWDTAGLMETTIFDYRYQPQRQIRRV